MAVNGATSTGLQWDVLSIRRPGLTRDLPPGKEDLTWVVTNGLFAETR
jgi:hypothetical protein